MRIEFLTKNYNAGEKLKEIIERKIERLNKFFEDDTKVKVMLKEANNVYTLEITIIDGTVMRAEVSSDNMYDNIDSALPKLEKQIVKHHTKLSSKSKKLRAKEDFVFAAAAEEKKRTVVKAKSYELSPMTVDDSIEELELVGHSFYVFLNKATNQVNVLYKRNDGDYGLIETMT